MACRLRRPRRRPRPRRQARPVRPPAVARGARRRALLGRRGARRRPARLAHRVHRHLAGPPRPPARHPGRRHRPGLPAPRDERGAVGGPHPRRHLRPALRAPGDGRLRGREDEQVHGATSCSCRSCAPTASTRWRSGSCCSTSTTAPTGSTRPTCSRPRTARLARWREALSVNQGAEAAVDDRRGARRRRRRPRHSGRARRRRRLGRAHAGAGEWDDAAAPGLVARTVDAVLGVRL